MVVRSYRSTEASATKAWMEPEVWKKGHSKEAIVTTATRTKPQWWGVRDKIFPLFSSCSPTVCWDLSLADPQKEIRRSRIWAQPPGTQGRAEKDREWIWEWNSICPHRILLVLWFHNYTHSYISCFMSHLLHAVHNTVEIIVAITIEIPVVVSYWFWGAWHYHFAKGVQNFVSKYTGWKKYNNNNNNNIKTRLNSKPHCQSIFVRASEQLTWKYLQKRYGTCHCFSFTSLALEKYFRDWICKDLVRVRKMEWMELGPDHELRIPPHIA